MTSLDLFSSENQNTFDVDSSIFSELVTSNDIAYTNIKESSFNDSLNIENELLKIEQALIQQLQTEPQTEDTITGTQGSDILTGDNKSNTIIGLGGNDTLSGLGGDDYLKGNQDDDDLKGGQGQDILIGSKGQDKLSGNNGEDTLSGEVGPDNLSGGNDNDSLMGGLGNDRIIGNQGDDILLGGDGDDTLLGKEDNDKLSAASGNDRVVGDQGEDMVVGGDGDDTLEGNQAADTLIGGNGKDRILGGDGNDLLQAGKDNDVLIGGENNDTFFGALGNDTLTGDATNLNDDLRGSDVFALNSGLGIDTIVDFQVGIDQIGLLGDLTFDDLKISQNGSKANLKVRATGEKLAILKNVNVDDLTEDDFIEGFDRAEGSPTGELDNAIDLGSITSLVIVNDSLNDSDPIDLYRFHLDEESLFSLNLHELTSDADVEIILDENNNREIDDNEIFYFSLQEGIQPEAINSPLADGTYYIRLRQVGDDTDYSLNLSAEIVEGIPIQEEVFKEGSSTGELSIEGISETTFNSLDTDFVFNISGAKFSSDPDDILLLNNKQIVPNTFIELSKDSTSISASSVLTDGINEIELYAVDNENNRLFNEIIAWSGSNTLNIIAVDEDGLPVNNANISAVLTEDQRVISQGMTFEDGQISFLNIPNRTISLEGTADDNLFASTAAFGSDGNVILKLEGFDEPSTIDNNDFSLGLDGWNIGNAPVELIPHQEPELQLLDLPMNYSYTGKSQRNERETIEIQQLESSHPVKVDAEISDVDLSLSTSGEGEQSISRTFNIKPSTESVTVRYQFITSEVPGGFFGTEFNDSFNVAIRSLKGGENNSEANSMNNLGLGAFDASGATAFREVTLPVDEEDDTVQVEIGVSNVADGLFDSRVIVDLVEESNLVISELSLKDIDNSQLKFLSVDGKNPYFGGNTRINGTITIEGEKEDSLETLELEIVQGGNVVATANLNNAAKNKLLNQPFGDDKKIEINSSQLLFDLPNSQAKNINVSQDGTLSLRVKAKSKNGGEVIEESGNVALLGRYTKGNRYGQRDDNRGGDDWALPSVIDIIEHFGNKLTLGDFSNMNGGSFAPDHKTHDDGTHVDGWFNGYNNRNAATAQTMIDLLNDPTHGSDIQTVYVTFKKTNNDSFWNAIKNKTLNDGRKASNVIKPIGGHTSHFHWIINS